MNPDIELQLRVVIKALAEVVGPAVNEVDKAAMEQLHLSIATLTLVCERVALQASAARAELANALALSERMASLVPDEGMAAAMAAARRLQADPQAAIVEIRSVNARLMAIAADVVDLVEDPALSARLCREVIIATKSQTDLARAWYVKSGFELESENVPDLRGIVN